MLISKSLIKQFGLDLFTYLFSSTKDLSHYFYRLSILVSYTNSYIIFIFYCLFELRVSLKNDLCYHSRLFLNLIFTNNHSTVYLTAFSHKLSSLSFCLLFKLVSFLNDLRYHSAVFLNLFLLRTILVNSIVLYTGFFYKDVCYNSAVFINLFLEYNSAFRKIFSLSTLKTSAKSKTMLG